MRPLLLILALLLGGPAGAGELQGVDAGIDQRPGAALPLDLAFRDETGAAVTLRQLLGGRPALLAPVLHHCPNICGVTLAGLFQAVAGQRFVPGRDFAILAFGIDPKEGPAEAASSLATLRGRLPDAPDGGLHALTGSPDAVAAVTRALGYRYAWDERIEGYAHVAATAVLTRDGRLERWLYGIAPEPGDIALALTEAGQGRIGGWGDQLLLLCYHYDPLTGRYDPLIWSALRLACGVTVAVGGLALGRAFLRERRAA